jgi:hypothetical protein
MYGGEAAEDARSPKDKVTRMSGCPRTYSDVNNWFPKRLLDSDIINTLILCVTLSQSKTNRKPLESHLLHQSPNVTTTFDEVYEIDSRRVSIYRFRAVSSRRLKAAVLSRPSHSRVFQSSCPFPFTAVCKL